MKNVLIHSITFSFLLLLQVTGFGQVLPATVTTSLQPPYSLYLEDYYAPGSTRLAAHILFNDFNEPCWNVRLRITIESDRIKLKTRPDFIAPPINVVPGVMTTISGADLEPYLDYNNLFVTGASDLLKQAGRLPEGLYKFCIEVVDHESGALLSHASCATAYISLHDPPRIITPVCGQFMEPRNPQNIIFQWHLTSVSPNMSMGVEYKLIMHEVIDITTDPRSAINNGKTIPIFESEWTSGTQYLYDLSAPMLDIGKIYVFYSQVRDIGGRDIFKNGGMSEICWFYYGYPENARLHLKDPVNNYKFERMEHPNFSWTSPNVRISGQPFEYYVRIVKLQKDQDTADAIEHNPVFFEQTLPITTSWTGNFIKPSRKLEPSVRYAWQVTCFSGVQKVAVSEIFVFDGPPLIDYLIAGKHVVKVTSTDNEDFNNLSGTGRLHIGKGDSVDVYFKNIKVNVIGNYFYLGDGAVYHDFAEPKEISLTPKLAENNNAYFYAEQLMLDKTQLQLKGAVKWPLPHAVQSADKAFVVAESEWYNFDNDFTLNGRAFLSDKNRFELLEPLGFQLYLNTDSYFQILDSKYALNFQGKCFLPEKVLSEKTDRISLSFLGVDQLFYFKQETFDLSTRFRLVKNTDLMMSPTTYVLDLSEKESPGKYSDNKSWKGMYFPTYEVFFLKNLDQFNQIDFEEIETLSLEITNSSTHKNWVDHDGLDFCLKKDLSFTATTFNTFPAKQKKIQLKIENNGVEDSWMKGTIKIPIISETEDFGYTMPVTERGFSTGYLDEELDGTRFTFNKDGGEQKMEVTIQRAVFANQEMLNMVVDLEWPHLGASIKNAKGFSIWGNYSIGFNKPNGSIKVDKQVKASVNGYAITLDVLGGGRQSNLYSIGASGQIVMGEDIAGPKGPAEVNLYSIAPNNLLDPSVSVGGPSPVPGSSSPNGVTISNADMESAAEQKLNQTFSSSTGVMNVGGDLKADLAFEVGNVNLEPEANLEISFSGPNLDPPVPSFSLDALQALMKELIIYLPEEKRPDALRVIELIGSLETEYQIRTFEELMDMKKLAAKIIRIKMEELIGKLLEPINAQVTKLDLKLRAEIDKLLADVNAQVEDKVKLLVDGIADGVIQLAAGENFEVSGELETVKAAITKSISMELTEALRVTVERNITSKFSGILREKLIGGLKVKLAEGFTDIGMAILDNKAAGPKIEGMLTGVEDVLEDVGTDILASLNPLNLKGTMMKMGNDLISEIRIEDIFDRMVDELLKKSVGKIVDKYVDEYADELKEQLGGEFMGVLADNVQLDFSNLDKKIMSGDVTGIIKFDPTNIKIETSVALVQGTIHFKNDDPQWGDAWGGDLRATVKIQPQFGAAAKFMNGKKDGLDFWFFEVEVSSLRISMLPTPFTFDGAVGRVYHHMQVNNTSNYMVSKAVDYGANLQLNFYDTPLQGSIIKFDVGAKVEMIPGGFYIAMLGNAKVGNAKGFSLANGKGEISYNSAEKHFIGAFEVTTNTKPLLCAGGRMGVDINGDSWLIAIGTREKPITVNPLCGGAFKADGWFMINKRKMDLGMHIVQKFRIASPWIGLGIIEVRPFAEAGFEFGAEAVVSWDPFGIENASVMIEMYAGVGVDYDWPFPGGDGTWYLARVALGGELGFQTIEETRIWGKLHGEVTVVGIEVGFSLKADHTF